MKLISAARTETGIGDKRTPGTGGEGKDSVVGAVERKGNVVARVIEHTDTETLNSFIREAISEKVSLISTDEFPGYSKLKKHGTVRHSAGQYVNGAVHTQTIDGFWSLLKRVSWAVFTKSAASTCRCMLLNSSGDITTGAIRISSARL